MSKGKWKNPKPDKKVQVGGKMNPDLAEWVKQNGGFPTVEKAVELYRKMIEESVMSELIYAMLPFGNKQIFIVSTRKEVEQLMAWGKAEARNNGVPEDEIYCYGVKVCRSRECVAGFNNITIDSDGYLNGTVLACDDDVLEFFGEL